MRSDPCCHRAAHQVIVIIDDAATYNQFVTGAWRKRLRTAFEAPNVVLAEP